MNKITNAITCLNCKNVLESPVFLPCSHSICQKHTNKRNSDGELKPVICHRCDIEHPVPASGEFPPNAQLAEIIESRINEIDFGKDYNEAKQSCEQFDELLTKIEQLLADPYNYTYEMVTRLKNKVQLKGEEIKLKIDEAMNRSFTKISVYENECKGFLTTSAYKDKFDELNLMKNSARNHHVTWKVALDQMKRNDVEWQNIKTQSEKSIDDFKSRLCRFQSGLLLQQRYDVLSMEIDVIFRKFEDDISIRINGILCRAIPPRQKVLDSKIVNNGSLNQELFKLCGFDVNQSFELLYRGSLHGFKATDFHTRCDNIPRTLTIVKVQNENIFGGYTEATWDCSKSWKCDKNAYLFSLVNKKNVPVKVNVTSGWETRAIFCSPNYGPVFGQDDMVIGDNSNERKSCLSDFGCSYKLPFMQKTFLVGYSSCDFPLTEIEVFRLI